MASVDSKFDDLWDVDIDSLTYYTIHKNTKKALLEEYLFWKVRLRIYNF